MSVAKSDFVVRNQYHHFDEASSLDNWSNIIPKYFYHAEAYSYFDFAMHRAVDGVLAFVSAYNKLHYYYYDLHKEVQRLKLYFKQPTEARPAERSILYNEVLFPGFYPKRYTIFGKRINIEEYERKWKSVLSSYALLAKSVVKLADEYEYYRKKEKAKLEKEAEEEYILEYREMLKTQSLLKEKNLEIEGLHDKIKQNEEIIERWRSDSGEKRKLINDLYKEISLLKEQLSTNQSHTEKILKNFEAIIKGMQDAYLYQQDSNEKTLTNIFAESERLRNHNENLIQENQRLFDKFEAAFNQKVLSEISFSNFDEIEEPSLSEKESLNADKENFAKYKEEVELNLKQEALVRLQERAEIAESRADNKIKEIEIKKEQKKNEIKEEKLAAQKEKMEIKEEIANLGLKKVENANELSEIGKVKQEVEFEKREIEFSKKEMSFQFIQLKFDLEKYELSIQMFAAKKEVEYLQYELQAKTRLVEMAEKINILEAKNIESERIKLETANKLAEIGLVIREQNLQIQAQMNEVEKRKIETESQLVQLSLEKGSVNLMLEKLEVEAQKKVNEIEGLLIQVKDGQFRNSVTEQLQLLNQKAIENQITMQLIGLTQRENLVDLRQERLTNVDYHNRVQMGLKEMQLLNKQNSLQAQIESERIAHANQQQNLYSRISSVQNQLERSQIELSGERALRKYLS